MMKVGIVTTVELDTIKATIEKRNAARAMMYHAKRDMEDAEFELLEQVVKRFGADCVKIDWPRLASRMRAADAGF